MFLRPWVCIQKTNSKSLFGKGREGLTRPWFCSGGSRNFAQHSISQSVQQHGTSAVCARELKDRALNRSSVRRCDICNMWWFLVRTKSKLKKINLGSWVFGVPTCPPAHFSKFGRYLVGVYPSLPVRRWLLSTIVCIDWCLVGANMLESMRKNSCSRQHRSRLSTSVLLFLCSHA